MGGKEQGSVQVTRETSKDGQVMRGQESRQMRTKGEGGQVRYGQVKEQKERVPEGHPDWGDKAEPGQARQTGGRGR